MEAENIIVKADIRRSVPKKRKLILTIFLVLLAASLIYGLHSGSSTYHRDAGETKWGNAYPEADELHICWFNTSLYYHSTAAINRHEAYGFEWTTYDEETIWSMDSIIFISLVYIVLAVAPFIVSALYSRMCNNTQLYITDEQVFGSYNSFIFKKTLQIPIEKVDNLTTISTFLDKLRTGKTLGVCSTSGVIRLHFVQNAEEVVSLTMERINKIKNKEKRARIIAQTAAIADTASTADKLKELVTMKDAGLISEEEYTKKREELLAKM